MYKIGVGSKENCTAFINSLAESWPQKCVSISIETDAEDYYINVNSLKENLAQDILPGVAKAVTDFIVTYKGREWLAILAKERYTGIRDANMRRLLTKAEELLALPPGIKNFVPTKVRIEDKIVEYLKQDNCLNVEGFFRFRIPEFWFDMQLALSGAFEQILLEKEYGDFLKLLEVYVKKQKPQTMALHIVFDAADGFSLWDESLQLIEPQALTEKALFDDSKNAEDLLLGVVLTLAPLKLTLHVKNLADQASLIKVLQSVFKERFKLCRGCNLCEPASMQH